MKLNLLVISSFFLKQILLRISIDTDIKFFFEYDVYCKSKDTFNDAMKSSAINQIYFEQIQQESIPSKINGFTSVCGKMSTGQEQEQRNTQIAFNNWLNAIISYSITSLSFANPNSNVGRFIQRSVFVSVIYPASTLIDQITIYSRGKIIIDQTALAIPEVLEFTTIDNKSARSDSLELLQSDVNKYNSKLEPKLNRYVEKLELERIKESFDSIGTGMTVIEDQIRSRVIHDRKLPQQIVQSINKACSLIRTINILTNGTIERILNVRESVIQQTQ